MAEGPLSRFTRIKHPVARDEELLVEYVADETVVYDSRTKDAHCLSPLAAVVFAHCDGETTIEQLAALATERLGERVDEPRVINALAQLQERDLLAVPPRDGLSRRQMIGKSAAAAGGALVGTSLITTILAPTPAAAASQFCTVETSCRCCNQGACPAVTGSGNCNAGGQNCCAGQGCNCTKATTTNNTHCKPGNAPATFCDCVATSCLCTPVVC